MQNIENVFQPAQMADKIADMRRGADWFFWIAALGILNSLIVTFGGLPDMLFGLGSTRLVDEMLRANSLAAVNPIGLFSTPPLPYCSRLLAITPEKGMTGYSSSECSCMS